MQLQEMRYAVAVMEHRSFTKAADALFVSQPALSQSIGRLEHELNTILFIRDRNHLYPTQAGILFVEEAKRILQMADDLRETMRGLCRTTTLSVGISNYYGQHYLPKIVPRFHEQCPEINVTFTEEISLTLETLTVDKRLDLAMVPFPIMKEELQSSVLKEEELYLALPEFHPWAQTHEPLTMVSLSDFKDDGWVFLNKKQRVAALAYQLCEVAGFSPRVTFETMNWDTVINMISIGMGIGFVPDVILPLSDMQKIRCYRIAGGIAHRSYAAVWRADSPKLREIDCYIKACQSVFGTLSSDNKNIY